MGFFNDYINELYLKNTNKKECYCSRKAHMDHSESDRKGKIEVFWRENPLQIDIQMISKGMFDGEMSI